MSSQPVDLTKFNHVSGSKNIIVKIHASFMVLAWIFCANFGQSVQSQICLNFPFLHRDLLCQIL